MVRPPDAPHDRQAAEPAPVPWLDPEVKALLNARVLDPETALTSAKRPTPGPTAYVAHTLLVRGLAGGSAQPVIDRLQALAEEFGLKLEIKEPPSPLAKVLGDERVRAVLDASVATVLTLSPAEPGVRRPVDSWELLQHAFDRGVAEPGQLALNHVMFPGGGKLGTIGGKLGTIGGKLGTIGGKLGTIGFEAESDLAGRVPVKWFGPDPRVAAPPVKRAPVVAVIDTAVGPHPWFSGTDGGVVPLANLAPTSPGPTLEPNEDLPDETGHGTFIAGLIRQIAPQADLLVCPVIGFSGPAREEDVVTALALMLARQLQAQLHGRAELLVDVVNLSLGYHHETADDMGESALESLLRVLGEHGVVVVAGVGNSGTTAPFVPAAFASVTSVGALNPEASTIALFSNAGAWVRTHRVGANLVSTMPVMAQGALTSPWRTTGRDPANDPLPRALPDPDDFSTGFALWSGTSFAAPVLAAEIAAQVARDDRLVSTDLGDCQARAQAALHALTHVAKGES